MYKNLSLSAVNVKSHGDILTLTAAAATGTHRAIVFGLIHLQIHKS